MLADFKISSINNTDDGNGGDTTIAKGLIVTLGFRLP
jgi:hypothetical protein